MAEQIEAAPTATETASPGHPIPFWKGMVLALCAWQLGPALMLVTGYQLHWSGGNAWLALAAAGVICVLIATAISYVARRFAGNGTLISYARSALPHWAVCIVASCMMLGYIIGPSTMTMWSAAKISSILLQFGFESAASPLSASLLVLLVAALAGYCAYRGLELSARVSLALGILSIPLAVGLTLIAAVEYGLDFDYSRALSDVSWSRLAVGVFIALGSFVGFDGVCAIARETTEPTRNVPRMLYWTVVLIGITNVVGAVFQTPVLFAHAADLEAGRTPTYVLMHASGLSSLYVAFDAMLCIAELAGIIAWLNLSALIIAAAARDGFLPRTLGAVHSATGSPCNAVVVLASLSAIVPAILQALAPSTLLISMAYVTNVLVLYWMVAYAFVCAAVIVLHRRTGERPGITYGASVLAIVALVAVYLAQDLHPFDDVYMFSNYLGLGLLLVGASFLFATTRHRQAALEVIT
jgi:amino acid transporter